MENLVYQSGLTAEHGLSLYIEDGDKKILFDTGQSEIFLRNAEKLNINLKEIDYVVISHGHYDHTGGLKDFLNLNKKAILVIKNQAFGQKYSDRTDKLRYIGMPIQKKEISNEILIPSGIIALSSHIKVIPDITIFDPLDTHFNSMKIKKDEKLSEDSFEDEQFLIIEKDNKLSIISGCSHRGISNIVLTALSHSKTNKIHSILGGFHLKQYNLSQNKRLIKFFKKIKPEQLHLCHCTGVESFSDFKKAFPKKTYYNYTGNQKNI